MIAESAVDEFIRLRYPRNVVQVFGYEEAVEVFRSTSLFRETDGAFFEGTVDKLNGPPHTQRRRILNPAFRREHIETYRSEILIPTLVRALEQVHGTAAPGEPPHADLAPLAQRIFLQFAAALVGIENASDPERSRELLRFYLLFSNAEGYKHVHDQDPAILEQAREAQQEFVDRFLLPSLRAVESRDVGEHTLMALFANRADPAWNDPEQLAREAILFLIASVDTSANFLVHLMNELWTWFDRHPEDFDLRADPSFLKGAVDEASRLHPNLPESPRIAVEDVRLSNGVEVKAGQYVLVRKNFANRDVSVFGQDADQFDPRRELPRGVPGYGIAFGAGSHKCIGTPVVVGHGDLGSHAQVVTHLFDAGIERDPERTPVKAATYIDRYDSFPVIFRSVPTPSA